VNLLAVRIPVWDASRKQWRQFFAEAKYTARCGNGLHQFGLGVSTCACGAVQFAKDGLA